MARKKLTIKEELFCKEAVATANPTEAVRRVYDLGAKGGNNNDQTARAIASENLTKPHIKQKITELITDLNIDKNSRLKRLAEIFYSDDKDTALKANDQITKILGEYADNTTKIVGLFGKIEQISE